MACPSYHIARRCRHNLNIEPHRYVQRTAGVTKANWFEILERRGLRRGHEPAAQIPWPPEHHNFDADDIRRGDVVDGPRVSRPPVASATEKRYPSTTWRADFTAEALRTVSDALWRDRVRVAGERSLEQASTVLGCLRAGGWGAPRLSPPRAPMPILDTPDSRIVGACNPYKFGLKRTTHLCSPRHPKHSAMLMGMCADQTETTVRTKPAPTTGYGSRCYSPLQQRTGIGRMCSMHGYARKTCPEHADVVQGSG